MSGFQITCANKNTSGAIVRIGGVGWSLTAYEAISQLVTQRLRFNIMLAGVQYDVGVHDDGADAYLVLESDGKPLHAIENLPSC